MEADKVYELATGRLQCLQEFDGSLRFATILAGSNVLGLLGGKRGAPKDFRKGEVLYTSHSKCKILTVKTGCIVGQCSKQAPCICDGWK
jgi:hypothetical protein